MKKNNPVWILAVLAIGLILVLNIVMFLKTKEYNKKLTYNLNYSINNSANISFGKKTETGESCPDSTGGSERAYLQVKYFYSNFCPWCIKEEPILDNLVGKYGNLINIGWYNIRNCANLTKSYKISGVPTFIFSTMGNTTEYSYYGFIYEDDLMKLICDVTGGC